MYHLNFETMEFLNRVELRGNIGSVRTNTYNGRSVANLTIATGRAYRSSGGEPSIETTWHNVTAWQGKGMPDFSLLEKGMKLHVIGRIVTRRFTGDDGIDRTVYEIAASSMDIVEETGQLSYEA